MSALKSLPLARKFAIGIALAAIVVGVAVAVSNSSGDDGCVSQYSGNTRPCGVAGAVPADDQSPAIPLGIAGVGLGIALALWFVGGRLRQVRPAANTHPEYQSGLGGRTRTPMAPPTPAEPQVEAQERAGERTAPGWFKNPQGSGLRYWNGDHWTDNYHPGHPTQSGPSTKDVLWALSLGFGAAGATTALVGIPVLAYYWPLGLGGAGIVLAIAAVTSDGDTPWYAVVAVLASVGAFLFGISGYNEFSDAQREIDIPNLGQ